ncbi:hypothetical protein FXO38_29943 [Capsicum annuum]|nr:hypothetical protein FXO38_29943 [Capsicum annuum]
MNFGTGAVKITPAHDPNDFEVGQRHKLEFINIFTDDGNINSNAGPDFEGMPRFNAPVAVTEALKKRWLENIRGNFGGKEFGVFDDHWIVARNEEEALDLASRIFSGKEIVELSQDPDVLDTLFSAGLFPLSVLGWPDNTAHLKAFYPASVLETGHDLIFFGVARMVMLGIKLGGNVPFSKVNYPYPPS